MILPVVMAGGSGSRLWPLSRSQYPKQFLPLMDSRSLMQAALERLSTLNLTRGTVICGEDHRFIVAEQLRGMDMQMSIILEPSGKNTAPAIALAAFQALLQDQTDPVLLVVAADHVINDEEAFCNAIRTALPMAEAGKLVTFGIVPTSPNTGYGYIKKGEIYEAGHVVGAFVEKPTAVIAAEYLKSDEYLWNSGIFMFKASIYLEELKKHRPDIYSACEAASQKCSTDMDFIRVDSEIFETCPAESIDYAVMEHTERAVVIPVDLGWSDLGSWDAMWQIGEKDEFGNFIDADSLEVDTHNCLIIGSERLIASVGLRDLVIVDTKDALLVASKKDVQQVKAVVQELEKLERPETRIHREVYRPWGKYDLIDIGDRHQVKRITVNPGAKLSVQMHHHRAEHWVVVSGEARVTNGDKTFLVAENESTFIPIGVIHALENPGEVPLLLIEVQSGSYLGEDDIVRFEDKYGRA